MTQDSTSTLISAFGSHVLLCGKVNSPVSDLGLNLTINNLLNVYPDRIDGTKDPFGYRLQYPWRVSQFGFNGMYIKGGVNFKF